MYVHFLLFQYTWEQLYDTHSSRDVGTLYHIRQNFGLVNVSSNVKDNFESACSLMLSMTKAYMCNAFMEWAGLSSLDATPMKLKFLNPKSSEQEKREYMHVVIGGFVNEYIMVECDVEKELRTQREQARQQHQEQGRVQAQQHVVQQPAVHQQVQVQ